MAFTFYNSFKQRILTGNAPNFSTANIAISLHTSAYSPSIDNHDFFNDVGGQVSGTGYTAGGKLVTLSVSQDNTNDRAVVSAASVTWGSSSITARYAVARVSAAAASAAALIGYEDFSTNKTSDGDNFIIDWNNTNGMFYLS